MNNYGLLVFSLYIFYSGYLEYPKKLNIIKKLASVCSNDQFFLHSITITSLVWTSVRQDSQGSSQQILPQGVVRQTMLSIYSMRH